MFDERESEKKLKKIQLTEQFRQDSKMFNENMKALKIKAWRYLLKKTNAFWCEISEESNKSLEDEERKQWLRYIGSVVGEIDAIEGYITIFEIFRCNVEQQKIDFFLPNLNKFLEKILEQLNQIKDLSSEVKSQIELCIINVKTQVLIRHRHLLIGKLLKIWNIFNKAFHKKYKCDENDNVDDAVLSQLNALHANIQELRNRENLHEWAMWFKRFSEFVVDEALSGFLQKFRQLAFDMKNVIDNADDFDPLIKKEITGDKKSGLIHVISIIDYAIDIERFFAISNEIELKINATVLAYNQKHRNNKGLVLSQLRKMQWYSEGFGDEETFAIFFQGFCKACVSFDLHYVRSDVFDLLKYLYETMNTLQCLSEELKQRLSEHYCQISKMHAGVKDVDPNTTLLGSQSYHSSPRGKERCSESSDAESLKTSDDESEIDDSADIANHRRRSH